MTHVQKVRECPSRLTGAGTKMAGMQAYLRSIPGFIRTHAVARHVLRGRRSDGNSSGAVHFVVECRTGQPPRVFPQEGRILIMAPIKLNEAKGGYGLSMRFGDPGTPAWPPAVNSAMSYHCELISDAAIPLFDVEVTFNLRFKKDDPRGVVFTKSDGISRTWTFGVPHVAPQERVMFYAFNNWIPEYIEMTTRYVTYKASVNGIPQIASVTMAGVLGEGIVLSPATPASFHSPASRTAAQLSPR
jgi:hypothetical protein